MDLYNSYGELWSDITELWSSMIKQNVNKTSFRKSISYHEDFQFSLCI